MGYPKGYVGPRKTIICPCRKAKQVPLSSKDKYCDIVCSRKYKPPTVVRCSEDCTCARHSGSGHYERTGYHLELLRQVREHITRESREKGAAKLRGKPGTKHTTETKIKMRNLKLGKPLTEGHIASLLATYTPERRMALAETAWFNFTGGHTAVEFTAVLSPAGFVREHHVQWGGKGEHFKLDFAHLEAKVCIELDGPSHKATKEYDGMRDALLRAMGWRVIRIRHD